MPNKDPEVRKQYAREYYLLNREKLLAKQAAYADTHKAERKIYQDANRDKIRALVRKSGRKRYQVNRQAVLAEAKRYRRSLKQQMIDAYGGACACCGDTTFEFLSLEHKHGGGKKHYASLPHGHGSMYRWLRDRGWPKDEYTVLCCNCNFAKGHYGICPHEAERARETFSIVGISC